LIRLAGIHADSEPAKDMIQSGKKKGLENPWDTHPGAKELWFDWWRGTELAKGQTPSEMFLWYAVQLNFETLEHLFKDTSHLQLSFRGSTEEALDIYCAQLKYSDRKACGPILPTYDHGLLEQFYLFADWIHVILAGKMTGISVDKYKQTALLLGALVSHGVKCADVSDDMWDVFGSFLRSPRKVGAQLLGDIGGYPEQKGRWGGMKGQFAQCKAVRTLVKRVLSGTF